MQRNVNLIPGDLSINTAVSRAGNVLWSAVYYLGAALIISIVGFIGLFFYNNYKVKNLNLRVDDLKNQVSLLEASEQRLILIRDRLDKVSTILASNSAQDEIALVRDLVSQPTEVSFAEIGVDTVKMETSLVLPDSSSLGRFISQINQMPKVKSMLLSSLSYNPTAGYLASLVFETDSKEKVKK